MNLPSKRWIQINHSWIIFYSRFIILTFSVQITDFQESQNVKLIQHSESQIKLTQQSSRNHIWILGKSEISLKPNLKYLDFRLKSADFEKLISLFDDETQVVFHGTCRVWISPWMGLNRNLRCLNSLNALDLYSDFDNYSTIYSIEIDSGKLRIRYDQNGVRKRIAFRN